MKEDLSRFAADIERRCEAIEERLSLDATRVFLTALDLLSHDARSLRTACEAEYVAMVRAAAEMNDDGYSMRDISTDAVAALYTVAAELVLGTEPGGASTLLEAQDLLGEAIFMMSRADVSGAARDESSRLEQSRRQVAGAKGGRPRLLDDEAVNQFLISWQRDGKPKWGSIKAAAHHFDVTEKAIQGSLKRLQSKPS